MSQNSPYHVAQIPELHFLALRPEERLYLQCVMCYGYVPHDHRHGDSSPAITFGNSAAHVYGHFYYGSFMNLKVSNSFEDYIW